MPTINTPTLLKNEILSRLGSPINVIEVTDNQVERCIDRAVELYVDYHCDGTNKFVGVIALSAQEAATGILQFKNQPITAITHIFKSAPGSGVSWYEGAIYDAFWHQGQDLVQSMRMGGSSGGLFFTDLEMWYQYRELQQTFFAPDPDFHYNTTTRQLKIFDSTLVEGQVILVECYIAGAANVDRTLLNNTSELVANGCSLSGYNDQLTCEAAGGYWGPAYQSYSNPWVYNGVVDPSLTPSADPTYFPQDAYNNRWLKDMATALVKQQWGWNLFKFKDQALPGGVTVNADAILSAAETEIEKLRAELLLIEAPCEFWLG